MANEEGKRWTVGGEPTSSGRLTRLLHSSETIALVVIALLLFAFLVTGNLLGLW